MTVCVVGALHLDVVLDAPHLPKVDETVTGSAVRYAFGGKGGNQAVAAARLGTPVNFIGRAGSDGFGKILRQELERWEIDISQLQTDKGPSGMSAAIVDASGEYGAVIVSAANQKIDPRQFALPPSTSVLLLQNEVPEPVNIAAAHQARDLGAAIWLNAAPARPVSPKLAELIDLLIVNRVEAEFYRDLPMRLVLETRGAEGVHFADKTWPARKVDVMSAHGAGDMFIGALAAELMRGSTVDDAIPFAQAAAAWHISTPPDGRAGMRPEMLRAHLTAQLNP